MNAADVTRKESERGIDEPIWYQQYVAMKVDLKKRYPEAESVATTRDGYNRMSARVEAKDLHVMVFYWFLRGSIEDSWVVQLKKTCNDNCLHSYYPDEDPHRIHPKSWWRVG